MKINLWNAPDRRGDTAPKPHSHPWAFTAHILTGGYNEDRYTLTGDHVHTQLDVTHLGGSTNSISHSDYHEVTEIHERGRTLSLMVCGPGQRGAWGYLDTDAGRHVPHQPAPDSR
ncbi:hypothetical protein [Streptomyces sp. SD15]